MNNSLTISEETIRIPLVGETEVGSAEVQPTRDSQLKATNCRWDGSHTPAVPFYQESKTIQSFLMPKKTSLPKARILLTVKGICPIYAEPVHSNRLRLK